MKRYLSPKSAVLNGRAFGFALIDRLTTLSLKNAQKIDWHAHEEIEVLCCLKGSLAYEFRERAPVTLTTGCFIVIPAGMEHRLAGGIDGPCRRLSFFIRERRASAKSASPLSTAEMRELLSLLLRKRLRPHEIKESARLQITRLASLLEDTHALTFVEKLTARSDSLAALLALSETQKDPVLKTETRLMSEAVAWLTDHYSQQVTIAQLTSFMGYGRARFFTLFKSYTGQSPVEWLILLRIDRAKRLLATTESSIHDIARSCGFTDPAFFARIFRRRVGNSPSGFRRENGGTP